MSHEITNQAIELSADELDVVNGGAAFLDEEAIFGVKQTGIVSFLENGPNGSKSFTATSDVDIFSAAFKDVAVGL